MLNIEYSILFAFFTALLISYLVIPKLIVFADKYRLADIAGKRASHKGSIPIFGGIAIFSGVIFALLFWADLMSVKFLIVSFTMVFFVGMVDDLLGLNPYKKLIGQFIAILVMIYLGNIQIDSMHGVLSIHELPHLVGTLFTAFVVVVITNGFNLIDGIDGLAAGLGSISAFFFGIVALIMNQLDIAIIAFALMGALIGFMRYNFHPAKIFMGDTGSLLVGMILSVLAINLVCHGLVTENISYPNKGPLLAIAFLAIPLFDSLRVFVVRIRKGVHPLYPGRGHIHHACLRLGMGHKGTSLVLYFFTWILIMLAYFLLPLNINLGILILAIISFGILIVPFYIRKYKLKK